MQRILGISAYYHDSAAALIVDGEIIAAAEEERFTRIKHDSSFPANAIQFCLQQAQVDLTKIDAVVFYEKPIIKFERILETALKHAPRGFGLFFHALPDWLNSKLNLRRTLQDELKKISGTKFDADKLFFSDHHLSHAASAYYPSGFDEAAILTIDGVGEWATTCISHGVNGKIKTLKSIHYPDSLGLFYACVTYYLGFKPNADEYKVMGLSPYGQKESDETRTFMKLIREKLINSLEDGSFSLNSSYFTFSFKKNPIPLKKWENLFGFEKRQSNSELNQRHANFALAAQMVVEELILKLAEKAKKLTGSTKLVIAGGVGLNCVANGKLLHSNLFDDYWIHPAPGDNGAAIGAALAFYHLNSENKPYKLNPIHHAFFGNSFKPAEILEKLKEFDFVSKQFSSGAEQLDAVAELILTNKIIGWVKGRMEFGPRALGGRSILASPLKKENQTRINRDIKFREDFRPFAPVMLSDEAQKWFNFTRKAPFMQYVVKIRDEYRNTMPEQASIRERVLIPTSPLEAVTHVDHSARIQVVAESDHPLVPLLQKLQHHGHPGIVLNTSFNTAGEPIVCSLDDIFRTFQNTALDALVIEDFLIKKNDA